MNWTRLVRLPLLPLFILATGLGVTFVAWNHERQVSDQAVRAQFDFSLREAIDRIEQRMAMSEQMLRGVQGLLAATDTMGHSPLNKYVDALQLDANYAGIKAIGINQWLPAGVRKASAPVIQYEPHNHDASGFDPWSDPVRRLAMEKARDSGMAAITGKVQLIVDTKADAQPAFIMYLPVYTPGQALNSVAQRRANLSGWVFAAFRIKDLMASLYGEQQAGLSIAIFDGVEPSPAARLYASSGTDQTPSSAANVAATSAAISANEYMVVAGHTWTLSLQTQDDFTDRFGRNAATLIALAGTGLSLLLALLAWLMATGRNRAMRLAGAMTKELRIAAVAFDSLEGMMVTDTNNVILRVNKAFTEITGYSSEEAIGQTPRLLHSGRQTPDFYRAMWETIARTGGWQGEVWDRRKNGEIYPQWLSISAVKDNDGTVTHYIAAHHDISERKNAEAKIKKLAFFDQLTGLPNRTLLLDRLKQTMATSARDGNYAALLFIDLDNFKTLNDTLGHDMGDLLLQQVAQRLSSCVRGEDTVARLGGDEFIMMLLNQGKNDQDAAACAEAVATKVLTLLNQPYSLDGVSHHSTPSIGVALFNGQQVGMDDLIKQADIAMYRAKSSGRNAIRFFYPAMQTAVIERAALEHDLRQAIEDKQFVLHYQAQVISDGLITGAEVLVRWQHPQRGLVPPADFIPMAEETGLILPLGQWVLQTACTQLAAWAAQPEMRHLTVAVNVSAQQFRQPDFVAQVLAVLTHTGANPHRLKLELTESLLIANVEEVIEKMFALKAKGVGFSLDDFGTGYSSLSYLKRLPLDQLKIDQSFVRDVLSDPNDAAIAKTIIGLAQSLGLGVIAEGVETAAQRDFLFRSGCHAYQGYWFSRPLPLDGFEKLAQKI